MLKRTQRRNQIDVQRDETWTNTCMPAFRAFHTEHGHANVPQKDEALGKMVSDIRMGHTQIPPTFEEELTRMGFLRRTTNVAVHVLVVS